MRERLYNVIHSPYISEKSTVVAEKNNQFVFKVAMDANKIEIKQAVEGLFNVNVIDVQVVRQKGKVKRRGQIIGRRNHTKKAYVRIAKDQDIQFTGLA